jgi:hypothetical protein
MNNVQTDTPVIQVKLAWPNEAVARYTGDRHVGRQANLLREIFWEGAMTAMAAQVQKAMNQVASTRHWEENADEAKNAVIAAIPSAVGSLHVAQTGRKDRNPRLRGDDVLGTLEKGLVHGSVFTYTLVGHSSALGLITAVVEVNDGADFDVEFGSMITLPFSRNTMMDLETLPGRHTEGTLEVPEVKVTSVPAQRVGKVAINFDVLADVKVSILNRVGRLAVGDTVHTVPVEFAHSIQVKKNTN